MESVSKKIWKATYIVDIILYMYKNGKQAFTLNLHNTYYGMIPD